MPGVTQSGRRLLTLPLMVSGQPQASTLPRVFVTHQLPVAKWLAPNMQEITWELYLARWAHVLIWLEAEADWINLGENGVCGVPAEHFPPSFLGFSGLPGVTVVDHQWRLKKRGLCVLAAGCCSTGQGSWSSLCCTARTSVVWVSPPEGAQRGLHPPGDLSQLLCLKLDMITMLPSTLSPQAPSQVPWLSHSSGFPASFPPETGIRRPDEGSSSGWSPLRKRQPKVTFPKSSPCPSLSLLAVHQADPLPGDNPWHWLSPGREDTHKTWNLHVEVFSPCSQLSEAVQEGSPCSYLPFMQLSYWRCVGNYLQQACFTAHKIRLVLDQTL